MDNMDVYVKVNGNFVKIYEGCRALVMMNTARDIQLLVDGKEIDDYSSLRLSHHAGAPGTMEIVWEQRNTL